MSKYSPLIGRPPFLVRKGIAGPVTYNDFRALPDTFEGNVMRPSNWHPPGSPFQARKPALFGPGGTYNVKVTLGQLGELMGGVKTLKLSELHIPPPMGSTWDEDLQGARNGTISLTPGEAGDDDADGFQQIDELLSVGWSRSYAINSAPTGWGDHRDGILGGRLGSARGSGVSQCAFIDEEVWCAFEEYGAIYIPDPTNITSLMGPGTPVMTVPQINVPHPNPGNPPITYGPLFYSIRALIGVFITSFFEAALNDLTGSGSIFDPGNEIWVGFHILVDNENNQFGGFEALQTEWWGSQSTNWVTGSYPNPYEPGMLPLAPNGIITLNLPSGPLEIPALYWMGEGSGGTCVIDAIPWGDLQR